MGKERLEGYITRNRVFAFKEFNLKFQANNPAERTLKEVCQKRRENPNLSERFSVNFHQ